jgi:hypothetical protein
MFYTMPWNMIATVTSMTTCVSLCTPPYLLISTYFWSKKVIFIRFETVDSIEGEWKTWNSYILENTTTHTEHTSLYILHHFTFYFLLKSTFSDANRAVMWWYALPNRKYNLECLVEKGTLHSVSQHKWNSTIKIHLHFVHTTTYLPHITVHFFQKIMTRLKECYQWHVLFQHTHNLLMTYIMIVPGCPQWQLVFQYTHCILICT